MSFTNSYNPPPPAKPLSADELYGPDPYDVNFCYPLHFPSLETSRVKLTPFIPRIHGDYFWSQIESNLDLFRYYPFSFADKEDFFTVLEGFRRNPDRVLLAVIDKTKPDAGHPEFGGGSFAGLIGFLNSVPANLMTEIGFVVVLPAFQRTHVASNAAGAALKYCLELPSADFPGLGLRRVEWRAHSRNLPSVRLAERMGFTKEGTLRWHMALPPVLAKDADKPREGDKYPERHGRHTVVLGMTWEDWENGGRDVAQKNVNRI